MRFQLIYSVTNQLFYDLTAQKALYNVQIYFNSPLR